VEVELELLVPLAGPAITPLSWDLSVRWFASFANVDRHQQEQGRNRRRPGYMSPCGLGGFVGVEL
jgi:hypothetical protein